MAFLAHFGVAEDLVQNDQHQHGIWANLTPRQVIEIRHLLADDSLGLVTREQILERLHRIAR